MSESKIKKPILRILNNFNPALVSSLTSLGLITPEFLPFIALSQSILNYYGEYANKKTIDLFQEFEKNKDKIKQTIIQDDKFKSSFVKIIGNNITESNEEKRQLLKNYILNFACGVEPNFNEHSRIINVLNTLSLYELKMLKLMDDMGWKEGKINKDFDAIEGFESVHYHKLNFKKGNREKNKQVLLSLGYKNLLYVLSKNNHSGDQDVVVKEITEFGKIFLKFIKK